MLSIVVLVLRKGRGYSIWDVKWIKRITFHLLLSFNAGNLVLDTHIFKTKLYIYIYIYTQTHTYTHVCMISHFSVCNSMDCSQPGSSVLGDSPDKNTAVGCHALVQGIFPIQELNLCLLCCVSRRQEGSLPLESSGIYNSFHRS